MNAQMKIDVFIFEHIQNVKVKIEFFIFEQISKKWKSIFPSSNKYQKWSMFKWKSMLFYLKNKYQKWKIARTLEVKTDVFIFEHIQNVKVKWTYK